MDMNSTTNATAMEGMQMTGGHERCNGTVDLAMSGSWQGHIGPGLLFVFWGIWTVVGVFRRYIYSNTVKSKGRVPYVSRAWQPVPFTHSAKLFEPIVKLFGVIGILVELRLDHDSYMYMVCPEGTLRAGRFALDHVHNWQHAANYPAFIMTGAVDLLVHFGKLPHEISQVFLALAFAIQSFLMGTHVKHIPLDQTVHQYLFFTMLGCTVFALLEAAYRKNAMMSVGRAYFVTLQGAWLCMIARIMFEDRVAWSTAYMGSNMLCPVFFTMLAFVLALGFLFLYCVLLHFTPHAPLAAGYAPVAGDVEMCEHTLYESTSEDGHEAAHHRV
jgi:hypothetical protein